MVVVVVVETLFMCQSHIAGENPLLINLGTQTK